MIFPVLAYTGIYIYIYILDLHRRLTAPVKSYFERNLEGIIESVFEA